MSPRFKRARSNQKGVSFIELLIAVTILSFLGTAVFGVFTQGLRLRQRAASLQPDLESDLIFEKITGDLTSAYPSGLGSFKGEEDSFQMMGYAASGTADPQREGIPEPARIRYALKDGALERSQEPYETLLAAGNAAEPKVKEVAAGVKECHFEYYHRDPKKAEYQWKSFWQSDCLPKAVRVSLRFDDEKKIQPKVKVIALPAGRDYCQVPAA
jgi:type II secretion system protein J